MNDEAEKAAARTKLEAQYGQVWNTDQLREEFEVIGFAAPIVVVKRRDTGQKGSLEFTHWPRFYFQWVADPQ